MNNIGKVGSKILFHAVFINLEHRAVARTLIGGGGVFIHIFMFCPTSFFSN